MEWYFVALSLVSGFVGGVAGAVLVAWYSVALARQERERAYSNEH